LDPIPSLILAFEELRQQDKEFETNDKSIEQDKNAKIEALICIDEFLNGTHLVSRLRQKKRAPQHLKISQTFLFLCVF